MYSKNWARIFFTEELIDADKGGYQSNLLYSLLIQIRISEMNTYVVTATNEGCLLVLGVSVPHEHEVCVDGNIIDGTITI